MPETHSDPAGRTTQQRYRGRVHFRKYKGRTTTFNLIIDLNPIPNMHIALEENKLCTAVATHWKKATRH